ncbi:FtsX-like permease family protein [Nocardioides ultimimeridianus]
MTATSGYAGWRVALRLARREAWRRKGQTALMLVLIALPVLAVTTAAVVWKTATVSGAEGVTRRMGAADALVTAPGGGGRAIQCFDPDVCSILMGGQGRPTSTARVEALMGDRPVVALGTDTLSYPTSEGIGDLSVTQTDFSNPLTGGLFRLHEGRMPLNTGEIAINPAAVARGPRLGQTLELIRKVRSTTTVYRLKVVGIADYANNRSSPFGAVLPGAVGSLPAYELSWLVGGGPVSWAQVQQWNHRGLIVASRAVLTDPPPESELPEEVQVYQQQSGVEQTTITIIALIASMVLLEVVLLAGPAFAVRAKAQAHTLALVAATGGTPAQARRTILASGVVVGAVGGVVGAGLGVLLSYAAVPIAQDHSSSWFGPREVPWLLVLAVAGFGFVSAFLAAVVPAYSASRQNVVAVLAGRRGEGRPSRRSPFVGLVLIGLGIAGAVLGGRESAVGTTAAVMVGGSAIVSVIGMIFFVPAAVVIVARLARRLPLSLRFAARDAARHRTRTVPAVAAVGATVAGVVALSIALSSQAARDASAYAPQLADGYAVVNLSGPKHEADVAAVVRKQLPAVALERVTGVPGGYDVEFRYPGHPASYSYGSYLGTADVVASRLPDYLGVDDASAARADAVLRDGGVVTFSSSFDHADGTTVTAVVHRADTGRVLRRVGLRATPVAIPHSSTPVAAVLSPQAAARLEVPTAVTSLVMPPTLSNAQQQDLKEALAAAAPNAILYVERGFELDPVTRIIQWVLALLGGVLMLGGTLTATFLALSDAKPDLATMAAVGARPRTRRGVAAAYALVVGAVGAVLGAPIGFIPGLAISRTITRNWQTDGHLVDVPWLLIGAIVVVLPLLTAAVVGLFARSRLPLVARID